MPEDNLELVVSMIKNELFNYKDLQNNEEVAALLWDISVAIKEKKKLKIIYTKMKDSNEIKLDRAIQPLGVLFSEYYVIIKEDI